MQEGQYAQYPRPPIKEIDFGVISEGLNLVWKNIGPFALGAFLWILLTIGINQLGALAVKVMIGESPVPKDLSDLSLFYSYLAKSMVFSVPFAIIGALIASPFAYAFSLMTLKAARGQAIEINDVFLGFPKFAKIALLFFLMQICMYIGQMLCCIPGLIAGGLFMFAIPILVDKDVSAIEALSESFGILKDHWLMATLFYFVVSLCSGLGVLACCVGIFVSMPLIYVCPTLVYRDFTMGRGIPVPAMGTPQPYQETPNPYPTDPTEGGTNQ